MNDKITFPENLNDFLYWVKDTTEAYWSNVSPDETIYGAKWLPLNDEQIDELELKYSIKFDIEHRSFLKVLHTTDKQYSEVTEANSDVTNEDVEDEDEKKVGEFWEPQYQPSIFYNWITETEWIESRLAWIEKVFIADILGVNQSWLKSWGECPESAEDRTQIFKEWYRKAPRLLPIKAHTFLMADGGHGMRPVMSVYGFDTVIIAWNLRHFLIREFAKELGLETCYYNDDYPEGYTDLAEGIPELDALQTIRLDDVVVPYWKEVLTYYNHLNKKYWQGFWTSRGDTKL